MTTNLLDRPMPPKVRQIINEVANQHQLTPVDLLVHDGPWSTVRARYTLYARIQAEIVIDHKAPSLPRIGSWTNRHHTSVLYGIRRAASGFEWRRDRRAGVRA